MLVTVDFWSLVGVAYALGVATPITVLCIFALLKDK